MTTAKRDQFTQNMVPPLPGARNSAIYAPDKRLIDTTIVIKVIEKLYQMITKLLPMAQALLYQSLYDYANYFKLFVTTARWRVKRVPAPGYRDRDSLMMCNPS